MVVHGSLPRSSDVVFIQCMAIWESLLASQVTLGVERNIGSVNQGPKWSPPRSGRLKLNCDASVVNGGEQVGIGVVVRGCSGDLRVAVGERCYGRLSPLAAELQAIIMGLELMLERRWVPDGVEIDCLEAVRLVNGDEQAFAFAHDGVLVERVRQLLSSLGLHGISHIPRGANGVAHAVATRVARLDGRRMWLGVGPDWLMDVIFGDRPVTYVSNQEASGAYVPTTGSS